MGLSTMLWVLPCVLASAFLVPGVLALLTRDPRRSRIVGFGGGAVASFLGLVVTLIGTMRGAPMRIPLPAPVPWAASELFIDGLSAYFLALIFLIGFLVSVYAIGYMKEFDAHRRGQAAPMLLNLLLLSMAFVVSAGDMLSFLLGWETMSLASYFLVVLDHEKREARQAGIIYLIATHIGTGGILLAFLFLVQTTNSFSFNGFATVALSDPAILSATFGFALLGFGTKAGIFPFHIWLPYAHPEAPSPVSAVMSGVMIKMGIYGIVRMLFYLLPSPPASFGATLLALGVISGVFGVLYAIVQHDLKRLLAFHSVENIGIILIGIGAASLCRATGRPDAAALLLAGGLFHVLNHAMFKALLFLGAGAVLQGAHTRNIEKLGGLMRGMPLTGIAFLAGSLAISAVPPFNGFASEFAIYRGLWAAAGIAGTGGVYLAAMAGLALIGGLAVVCFVKVVGTVFLGTARSAQASAARDPSLTMEFPMGTLALFCLGLGVFPTIVLDRLMEVTSFLPSAASATAALPTAGGQPFTVAIALAIAIAGLAFLRTLLLLRNGQRAGGTWGCGFPYATPRMQYTASSFADPILHVFQGILRPHTTRKERLSGRFLLEVEHETHFHDLLENGLYLPVYRLFVQAAFQARRLHPGYIHLYLAYILGAVVLLLVFFQ
ncbi:MAG: formate hydrogenlyase subunit 3/multisubunit Na+/H+ antiporter, MnhD subunit [Deltaproteobacteria bacterium]|nr:formate hydrogenlyase subunit 3/multisubunit Na+/H+ antiporter, MnhD subunit [Deltaproteobacteria bacterium]